jgi:dihydroorotase
MSWATLVDRMACTPARLFRLPGGSLARGTIADVTVFDPDAEWSVDPASFLSKGRNTPYAGMRLRGRPVLTVVGGRAIHRQAAGGPG